MDFHSVASLPFGRKIAKFGGFCHYAQENAATHSLCRMNFIRSNEIAFGRMPYSIRSNGLKIFPTSSQMLLETPNVTHSGEWVPFGRMDGSFGRMRTKFSAAFCFRKLNSVGFHRAFKARLV
ncbi:unnamed protein product [Amaranthus hypochondriacus]